MAFDADVNLVWRFDNKKDLGSRWEHDHYIDSHHQQSVQQKQEFAGR